MSPLLHQSFRGSSEDWLVSFDVRHRITPTWAAYAQYTVGNQIPRISVFDVPNARVALAPNATRCDAAQVRTVWASGAMAFAADIYSTKLDGAYAALSPGALGNVVYVLSVTEASQESALETNFEVDRRCLAQRLQAHERADQASCEPPWNATVEEPGRRSLAGHRAVRWVTRCRQTRAVRKSLG